MKDKIAPCHLNIIIIYSSDRTATTALLLKFICSSNNHSLTEYWNSCFAKFSEFTHVCLVFSMHVNLLMRYTIN